MCYQNLLYRGGSRILILTAQNFNNSGGRVVRASAPEAVDLGLIPSRVKLMTLKFVFTASLFDVQHYRDSVKNKPPSFLIVM